VSLTITTKEQAPGIIRLAINGFVGSNEYKELESALSEVIAHMPTAVILDMAALTAISSLGLRVIIKAHKVLALNEGKFYFVNLNEQVKKVFEVFQNVSTLGTFCTSYQVEKELGL
jgi:anti-anti-sigma factor